MKPRSHFFGALAALFLAAPILFAQDSTAVGSAAREESEANSRRVNTKIEQVEETLQAQQKKVRSLVEEIHALRDRVDAPEKRNETTAIKESIKALASKIEEVDKKRIADNKLIVERLEAIRKAVVSAAAQKDPDKGPPLEASKPSKNVQAPKVKKGDTAVR